MFILKYIPIVIVLHTSMIGAAQKVKVGPALASRYEAMDVDMATGIVHAYLLVAVPELAIIDGDDILPTRAAFESHLSKDIGAFSTIDSFTTRVTHNQAVPDFLRTEATSTFVGDKPDKKDPLVIHHYSVNLMFQHEWRRTHGIWQLTRLVEMGARVTMDGKALPEHF